jgi:hypothetical protein
MLESSCGPTSGQLHDIKVNASYSSYIDLAPIEIAAFGYLGPISLVVSIFLMYLYIHRAALRRPPGMMILWQVVAQTCLDLNWTFTGITYYYM